MDLEYTKTINGDESLREKEENSVNKMEILRPSVAESLAAEKMDLPRQSEADSGYQKERQEVDSMSETEVCSTAELRTNAEQAMTEDRLGEALALYRELGEREPRKAVHRYRQGECLRNLGDFSAAIDCYDQALDLWPDFAWARLRRSTCLLEIGQEDQALVDLDELQDNFSTSSSKYDRLLVKHVFKNLGEHHHHVGDLDSALSVAVLAVEHDQEDGFAWYHLGKLHHETGNASAALTAYTKAMELLGKGYIADRIARCLCRLDRYEDALATWQGIPPRERDWYILRNEARTRHDHGDIEQAYVCVRAGLKIRRNEPTLNFLAGALCEERQDVVAAHEHYKIAAREFERQYKRPHDKALEALKRLEQNGSFALGHEDRLEREIGSGVVSRYNQERGFGFINRLGQRKDLFFHVSDYLGQAPAEGQKVSFLVEQTARGLAAKQVRPAD